jgi:outer membrane lipoprotein-sorting protein
MKKKLLFLIMIIGVFAISGCGKTSESDVIKDLTKKINDSKAYYVEGTLEIVNNEDVYTYNVNVSYKEKDNYKVSLVNTVNNHEQIILRNSDGVYVVTPRINKSFKFQSDWPYNNSQVYLLGPLLDDITNDANRTFEKVNDGSKIIVAANYPNNSKLVKQEILLDKSNNIKKVTVFDNNGTAQITMKFNKIDLNSKFNDNYFDLKQIIDIKEDNTDNTTNRENNSDENKNTTDNKVEDNSTTENNNTNVNENKNTNENKNEDKKSSETKQTSSIEDVIYPMYIPANTYLSNKEKVSKDDGERLILTFDGDNPFMLIEETVTYEKEHLIVPTYGELEVMASTVAIVNDNSVNWIDNNIEYYVVSDKLSKSELLDIARSISVLPVSK